MKLTPYLLFDGNCAEAMTFYKACLGGELTITTLGDSPMKGQFPAGSYGALTDKFGVRWMFQGEKQG